MTDAASETRRPTPWHLWLVGVVAVLWNGMGVADFVMTHMHFEPYMSGFTEEQLAYFYGFPAWAVLNWAIGVFGGLAGAILLLLKLKWAEPAFALSLLALLVGTVYTYGFTDAYALTGMGAAIFNGVLIIVAVLLVLYARALSRSGVLH